MYSRNVLHNTLIQAGDNNRVLLPACFLPLLIYTLSGVREVHITTGG